MGSDAIALLPTACWQELEKLSAKCKKLGQESIKLQCDRNVCHVIRDKLIEHESAVADRAAERIQDACDRDLGTS